MPSVFLVVSNCAIPAYLQDNITLTTLNLLGSV
jgi:hypothetical protein